MSTIHNTSSLLRDIRLNLKTFNANLRGIREWCTGLGDHSDLVELRDRMRAPSEYWDTCHLEFCKAAIQSELASSGAKPKETKFLLRSAYSLFAQFECAQGVHSAHDAASILSEILDDPKLQPSGSDRATFVARRKGMRENLKDARDKWEIFLQDLKIVLLSERPENSVLRLFEEEKPLGNTLEVGYTVTVHRTGCEYAITYDEHSSNESFRCEVWASEKEMRFAYPWEDYEPDTRTVKKGAKALCWSVMPSPANWAPGTTLVTTWNELNGRQFFGAQTFC